MQQTLWLLWLRQALWSQSLTCSRARTKMHNILLGIFWVEWWNTVQSTLHAWPFTWLFHTDNFRVAMIDTGAVKMIVQTLGSQNVYARSSAADALCRMAGHGAISDLVQPLYWLMPHRGLTGYHYQSRDHEIDPPYSWKPGWQPAAFYWISSEYNDTTWYNQLFSCDRYADKLCTVNFRATMIEADAAKLFVEMLKSKGDNVWRSTLYLLTRMVKHGAIGHLSIIIGLIASMQTICGLL